MLTLLAAVAAARQANRGLVAFKRRGFAFDDLKALRNERMRMARIIKEGERRRQAAASPINTNDKR